MTIRYRRPKSCPEAVKAEEKQERSIRIKRISRRMYEEDCLRAGHTSKKPTLDELDF